MAAVTALGHIGVDTTDIDLWRRWGNLIGAVVVDDTGDSLGLRLDTEAGARILVRSSTQDSFAFAGWEVENEAALKGICSRLEAAGAQPKDRPDLAAERGVVDLVTFVDPDGFVAELYWGRMSRVRNRFLSPHGVDFSIGDMGIGHLVLGVTDFRRTMAFYTEVLGMVVTETMNIGGNRVAMVRCNPRHHSLAFAEVTSARPRVLHFAVEVDHLDALGAIRDRLLDEGFPISRDLGRHPGDGVISFYQPMGDAFEVEVAWGTTRIDERTWPQRRHDRPYWSWGHRPLTGAATALGSDVE
ncbi:VOC family protein [Rhodococcus pseudokoreensis]|uniref:VOC family protein n=1 Tax=Rhodococcus pseudokoreensis TaxID=2811421 RepID=A0A974ZYN0_9NOCA|nr:VOC family protein [Rhodococcus pseudokoreensis]QSE88106.1 VOC family protein [Rhodococcus pseudokoreensis]QSE95274.1 VOC family protein [Rhodococcus pseudokoreensis]